MSNLITHAVTELNLIDYTEDSEDAMTRLARKHVLQLIKVFSEQGHSGFSAPRILNLFKTLASFETLSPLKGTVDEWNDVSEFSGETLFQNKRNSAVFKRGDGTAYFYMELFLKKKMEAVFQIKIAFLRLKNFLILQKQFT